MSMHCGYCKVEVVFYPVVKEGPRVMDSAIVDAFARVHGTRLEEGVLESAYACRIWEKREDTSIMRVGG